MPSVLTHTPIIRHSHATGRLLLSEHVFAMIAPADEYLAFGRVLFQIAKDAGF